MKTAFVKKGKNVDEVDGFYVHRYIKGLSCSVDESPASIGYKGLGSVEYSRFKWRYVLPTPSIKDIEEGLLSIFIFMVVKILPTIIVSALLFCIGLSLGYSSVTFFTGIFIIYKASVLLHEMGHILMINRFSQRKGATLVSDGYRFYILRGKEISFLRELIIIIMGPLINVFFALPLIYYTQNLITWTYLSVSLIHLFSILFPVGDGRNLYVSIYDKLTQKSIL